MVHRVMPWMRQGVVEGWGMRAIGLPTRCQSGWSGRVPTGAMKKPPVSWAWPQVGQWPRIVCAMKGFLSVGACVASIAGRQARASSVATNSSRSARD